MRRNAWWTIVVLAAVLGCERSQQAPGPDQLSSLETPAAAATAAEPASTRAHPEAAAAAIAPPAPGAAQAADPAPVVVPAPASAEAPPRRAAEPQKKIRPAAVAGAFYPAEPAELTKTVDDLLKAAKKVELPPVRALICPHAGYQYSGPVAASAYAQLFEADFKTVIVLGPSHTAAFVGAAVANADGFATPLGIMPVPARARELAAIHPFMLDPLMPVRRPGTGTASLDSAHAWEHSVEVQLPFLQRVLPKAALIPVVVGQVEAARAAQILSHWIDARTLLVASSDLSHYQTYEDAQRQDAACVKAILDLEPNRIRPEDACGAEPIKVLLELAQRQHWKPYLLDQRNSGDTSGQKDRVVGYAAIAFCQASAKAEAPPPKGDFSPDQRAFLLELARDALIKVVNHQGPPVPGKAQIRGPVAEKRACFVTLTKGGRLRGCIGQTEPREALYQSVLHMTQAAALEDTRFPPVSPPELSEVHIEISVLTVPKPLEFKSPDDLLEKLHPNVDGVILHMGRDTAVYLPQVWEQIPQKEDFMNQLARKAGRGTSAWRDSDVRVLTYQVEAFEEPKH